MCEYDEKYVTKESFLKADNTSFVFPEGYSQVSYERDAEGNIVERCYLDQNGSPTVTTDGYSAVRPVYDAEKHVIREMYFDETGAAALRTAAGCAILLLFYTTTSFGLREQGSI